MLRTFRQVPSALANAGSEIKFPQKLKGTVLEKWADYWKNLFIDYRQMLQDLRSDVQDNPVKAIKWATCIASIYALSRNNPNEMDFKDNLKRIENEVVLVNEDCLNQNSMEHLRFMDTCYNEGVLQYRSLGIASVMYVTDLNESCDLYKSQCVYMKPTYLNLLSRIVDVGFMGKWWNLHIKTNNYDINY